MKQTKETKKGMCKYQNRQNNEPGFELQTFAPKSNILHVDCHKNIKTYVNNAIIKNLKLYNGFLAAFSV